MRESIPIVAWSAVNGLGQDTATVLSNLDAGRSGLGPSPIDVTMETVVGAVEHLPSLDAPYEAYDTRLTRIGLAAFEEMRPALERSVARHGSHRVGIVLGTSTGGLEQTEQAFQAWLETGELPPKYDYERQHNFAAFGELLAKIAGIAGPTYVVSTACSSSGKVAACAQRLINAGILDAVLVGGIDSLTRMTLQGFHSLGILSSQPCRPFDLHRDGINIGEGAAFFLIERGAEAPVHLFGVGESADAYRMSSPEPNGRGASEAMSRALVQAGLKPEDVDHIRAHGTATKLNDAAESKAIAGLFGDRVPVVSTKGYTGHLLGAAGATEAVFAIHALLSGKIPTTLGSSVPDPELQIQVNRAARSLPLKYVLSNSFAFGGSNVSVLLGTSR